MKPTLSKKDAALINKVKKLVKKGTLYSALHHVGDDDVKSMVEDVLEVALDQDVFKTVLAVFEIATNDELLEMLGT